MVKRKPLITRILLYPLTVGLFLLSCYFIALLAFGYNIKFVDGKLIKEKTGTMLLSTRPGDAQVIVDGQVYPKKTPVISFFNLKIDRLTPGEHRVTFKKEGYETWEGIFNVESGMVSWGNYILLLPNQRKATSYNFTNIKSVTSSLDKTKQLIVTADQEAGVTTFWEITSENKNQKKLLEKQVVQGEEYQPLAYSFDEERILMSKKTAEGSQLVVFEAKENGRFWELSAGYQNEIKNPVFNPKNHDEVLFLENDVIVSLNFATAQFVKLTDTGVIGLFPQDNEMLFVKDAEGDTGLWRIAQNGSSQLVIPNLPVSESYQISYLSDIHAYVVLPSKTKELLIFSPDSGNYTLKKIAGNVEWFLPSRRSKYLAYFSSGNVETFEVQKDRYFRALDQVAPNSISWAEDEANLFYVKDGSLKIVNYNGFYNKEITKAEGQLTVSNSYNLFFLNENTTKKMKDLFVITIL